MWAERIRRAALAGICALLAAALLGTSSAQTDEEVSPAERARLANVPPGMWIWISIHEKSLTLYEGTEVRKRYTIATGSRDTPSPIGVFRVNGRFAGELGGFGTRFLSLNVPWGQFGIHGTNRPASIGSNASHGCFRMLVRDSEELYGLVPDGATVVVEGGSYGLLDTWLRPLIPGDRNSHVAAVQRRLQTLGYYDGSADGIYGQGTRMAVFRARKALGLPALDAVDYAFYQAIGLILFE